MRACVRACVRACLRACVCACTCTCTYSFNLHDLPFNVHFHYVDNDLHTKCTTLSYISSRTPLCIRQKHCYVKKIHILFIAEQLITLYDCFCSLDLGWYS